jgi:transcriptional regulator GlxA family with amidase domain
MHGQILLYDGFAERDAIGALDVFQAARAAGSALIVDFVRLGSATVTSAAGLTRHVPSRLEPAPVPGFLVVPGAPWLSEAPPAPWAELQRRRLAEALAIYAGSGSALAGVGWGALLLADAGVLRGKRVAASGLRAEALRGAGADAVAGAAIVEDGAILTAAGATAGMDAALRLVARFAGDAIAGIAAAGLEHERR